MLLNCSKAIQHPPDKYLNLHILNKGPLLTIIAANKQTLLE